MQHLFLLERMKKICGELASLLLLHQRDLPSWTMKDGRFMHVSEMLESPIPFQEATKETLWGGRDQHAWFRAVVTTPKEYEGKPHVLRVTTGLTGWDALNPQFLVFVDGRAVQGVDVNHREILLTPSGSQGKEYTVDLMGYGGLRREKTTMNLTQGVLDVPVEKLFYDLYVPLCVAEHLKPEDKIRLDMLHCLNQGVNLLDLREPHSRGFYDSVDRALSYLEENFYGKLCKEQDVKATVVGHTHIDVAWHWTVAQTREKVARSFATVLQYMEQYPEYQFMSSQPQLYSTLKEDYPELFQRIKEQVAEGRFEPEGAMWVEADCNVISGESLVRQLLFGTRFFKENFGVENRILWLPDVFGYSAALPQILKKSGIDYFMTTKIAWNQYNKIPYDTLLWRGIDGTEILTHFITTRDYEENPTSHFTTYNGNLVPTQVMGAWQRYQQKAINNDVLISYGWGDGGGGPTKFMLENGRRMMKGIPGCPEVSQGRVLDYFTRLEEKVKAHPYLPTWVGELYLEYHRGTYTSMARNKRDNRKSELLYGEVELLSSLNLLFGKPYPQETINRNWEQILTNQFHDILPGSSIEEVYEVTDREYKEILSQGETLIKENMEEIKREIEVEEDSLVVFNTLGHVRSDMVSFPYVTPYTHLTDETARYPIQVVQKDGKPFGISFVKDVPSKGYKAFALCDTPEEVANSLTVSPEHLENDFFRIKLDSKGFITSLWDKKNAREVVQKNERLNVLEAFEDKPMNFDNWDIDIYYGEKCWEVEDVQNIEVTEEGPLRCALTIERNFSRSKIIQTLYIYKDLPRIDFDTYVDWKEDQVMLKAAFPVDVMAKEATYEIQFGNITRPTHWNTSWDWARFEVCGHKWADLSEEGFGVSLLNDSKYGHDIKDGKMRLTLLKSGIEPSRVADREEHRFVYSLYPHEGDFRGGQTPRVAYELNVPLRSCCKDKGEGALPQEVSFFRVDQENIVLETVKKAEDGQALILRLYECYNKRTKATIETYLPLEEVLLCTPLEKDLSAVEPDSERTFTVEFLPYEVKSFKLRLQPKKA